MSFTNAGIIDHDVALDCDHGREAAWEIFSPARVKRGDQTLHTNDKVDVNFVVSGFGSHVEHLKHVWFQGCNFCWPVSNKWNKDGHE
jgi:hypothetical protein